MKDNKLEVGDKVFRWHGYGSAYLRLYKVERLTPKQAVLSDGTKVENTLRKQSYGDELEAKIVGEISHVMLASPQLEKTYKEQRLRAKAKEVYNAIRMNDISLEQCEALIKLFPLPETAKP